MKKTRLGVLAAAFTAALAARAAAQTSDEIYDESRIASFRFTMSAADWQTLCDRDTGLWYRADMTWQPPGGTLETVPGVGLRRSGGGAPNPNVVWYTPRPSVRVSFNEFEFANPAGPGSPGRKWHDVNRIKLDSMIGNTDLSMMRDRLAYGILRAAGASAPRACHARVYVNGDFKGLWTVEEPVRKDFTRQRWGEDGGNLYEMEYGGSDAYDWRGTDPASYVQSPFQEHNNSPGGNYADLVELINIVNNGGNQIRSRLNAHIHMDRFLSYLAATTAYGDNDDIVHWGGGSNNHYWYHRASSNLMELIKWDPGASMGMYEPDFGIAKGQSPLGYRYGSQKIT
ncbi:MAG: CotH kinase family protein, partial [Anaerolineales bacterium]